MVRELLNDLIDKNQKQVEALGEVLEVLKEERDVLKANKPELLTGLLEKLQRVTASAMLAEAQRANAAQALADFLGCKPAVKDICLHLDDQDCERLKSSSAELLKMVISIKEISYTLSRQAEEHRFLAELILERLKFMNASTRSEALAIDKRA